MPNGATQDPVGFTVDDLAGKIKSQYPKYKDIDNQKLVDSWVKRYPRYGQYLIAQDPSKKIGAAPSPVPDLTPTSRKTGEAAPTSSPEHQSYFTELSKASEQLSGQISRWRPRWEDPSKLLQEPKWYQPDPVSGAMITGAGRAFAGGVIGGVKILSDLMSSLDPRELYQPTGKAQEVGKDIQGAAYGLTHAAKDLILHPRETAQDPDRLGQDLMNIAMTIDGGIKGAKAVTEHLFPDPQATLQKAVAATGAKTASAQAALAAQQASQAKIKNQIKWRAVADTYIHHNGVDTANDLVKADNAAASHVKEHATNLDSKIPSTDGVEAYPLAQNIVKAHQAIIQTPDPLNPTLSQLVKEASSIAPGKMSFAEARQFRSKIGAALQSAKGGNVAVLSRVYGDLTKQLRGLSKKYGLEESWDQYNELEAKRHKSFPILEKAKQVVYENGEGATMARVLKDEPTAKETIKSLSKYGLDEKKITLFRKNSNEILRTRPSENQRLTSYIYKWGPGTIPAMVGLGLGKAGASAAGLGSEGWIAGLGLGATVGASTVMLTEYLRAHRLSPQILSDIVNSREWPGRLKPPSGKFPTEVEEPSPSAPQAPTPQLPAGPTPSPAPTTGPTSQTATMPQPTASTAASRIVESMKQYDATKTVEPTEAPPIKTGPKVTKVTEGAEGREPGVRKGTTRRTKLAQNVADRERVAKVRSEKGSTALGGGTQQVSGGGAAEEQLKKAETRVNTPHIDVSAMNAIDLERQLQGLDPKKFKEALDMRKRHQMSSEEYTEVLRFFYTEAMEGEINASE